jgi:hypothetical protein
MVGNALVGITVTRDRIAVPLQSLDLCTRSLEVVPRLLEIGPRLLEALEVVLGAIEPGLEIGESRPDQAQMCQDFLLIEAPPHDLEGGHGAARV